MLGFQPTTLDFRLFTQRVAALALGWDICWFSTNIPAVDIFAAIFD
jgi:hypothetical protein